ncbi:uncharacterized protein C8R40DRAFT_355526 [Lentinula edodes]|uniref:uncharacterized protein n=1 Tax=Lentinula edodes TaxID=5353 RepID=UPI001E8EC8B5|nr:uncharacterized protein C8R40DRAFT_355526 [Lentinula edodes]KAH7873756.1 hypothetical protein C8R40DRAFT_355526 [Lentinula edodes]
MRKGRLPTLGYSSLLLMWGCRKSDWKHLKKPEPISNSQAELNGLHKTNAETQISSESFIVKLERTTLQLDGERSKLAESERVNDELKRSNDELKRQIAKWQSLESKGDMEMEAERKKRVELEIRLQATQNQLTKREGEYAKAEKRTAKAKQYLDDWKNHAETYQGEAEDLKKKLAKLEKVNKKLLFEVESFKEIKINKDSPVESEEEVARTVSQAGPLSPVPIPAAETSQSKIASKKSSAKPSSRRMRKASASAASSSSYSPLDVNADAYDIPATAHAKGKRKHTADSDSGTEIEQPQRTTRSRLKPNTKEIAPANDLEIEIIPQEDIKGRKGKRKAFPLHAINEEQVEGDGAQSAVPAKRRKRNDDPERPKPKVRGVGKNTLPSRAESTASTATVDPESGGSSSHKPGTTKKRKINLFQSSSKMDLSNLDFGSQGSGIPSVLSPLKPEQAIPARSTSFLSLLRR